jgi:membrane protein
MTGVREAGMTTHDRPGIRRRIGRGIKAGKEKYSGSPADYLWRRLNSVDFLNQAMILAATLLLCAVPFLIVVSALGGRSSVRHLGRRLGLSHQAASDLGHLFASSAATSRAVTGAAWVFFILSGIAAAGAIQGLYQRIFDLNHRVTRDMPRALIWLAVWLGWLFAGGGWVGPWVRARGPVVFAVVGLVLFTGFWWFTMWLLLAGRISWHRLFPSAVATGVFWLGMEAVFAAVFSGMVTSNAQEYGPIGSVFALVAYLIAIGVVVILGAVTGIVWQERGLSFRAAFRALRRTR